MADPLLNHFVVQLRDGTTADIALPSPRDKAAILAGLRVEQRRQLVANLEETKMPPDQRFVTLNHFDSQLPYGDGKFLDYFNSTEGTNNIFIRLAMKPVGVPAVTRTREQAEELLDNLVGEPWSIMLKPFGFYLKDDKGNKLPEAGQSGSDPSTLPPGTMPPPGGNPEAYRQIPIPTEP